MEQEQGTFTGLIDMGGGKSVSVINFPSAEQWEKVFANLARSGQNNRNWFGADYFSMYDKDMGALVDLLKNPPADPIEATVRRLQYQGHLPKALKRK